jgi:hypothetical protein
VASWADNADDRPRPEPVRACLACGARLQHTLARLGALRCIDCREADRPLDESLIRSNGLPRNA